MILNYEVQDDIYNISKPITDVVKALRDKNQLKVSEQMQTKYRPSVVFTNDPVVMKYFT